MKSGRTGCYIVNTLQQQKLHHTRAPKVAEIMYDRAYEPVHSWTPFAWTLAAEKDLHGML